MDALDNCISCGTKIDYFCWPKSKDPLSETDHKIANFASGLLCRKCRHELYNSIALYGPVMEWVGQPNEDLYIERIALLVLIQKLGVKPSTFLRLNSCWWRKLPRTFEGLPDICEKQCTKCFVYLPISNFYVSRMRGRNSTYSSKCKACKNKLLAMKYRLNQQVASKINIT